MVVSNRNGSLLIIAQGIGIIMLLFALALFTIWHSSPLAVALILGTQFLLFLILSAILLSAYFTPSFSRFGGC